VYFETKLPVKDHYTVVNKK